MCILVTKLCYHHYQYFILNALANQIQHIVFQNRQPAKLMKVTLCKTPTKSKEYKNYHATAVFDMAIAIVKGHGINWLLLKTLWSPRTNMWMLFYIGTIFLQLLLKFQCTAGVLKYLVSPFTFQNYKFVHKLVDQNLFYFRQG